MLDKAVPDEAALDKAGPGKGTRRRLGPQQRRAQLVEVGMMLLRDRPLADLALEDVAAAAGISRALPYHYFGTRTEFLGAVLEAAAAEFLRATDPAPQLPPPQRLHAGIEAYVDWVAARPSEFLALTRSAAGADPALRAVFERSRDALIDRLVVGIGADPAQPLVRLAAAGWAAMTEEMVARWNRDPGVPRADLVHLIEQAFWTAAAAAGHRTRPATVPGRPGRRRPRYLRRTSVTSTEPLASDSARPDGDRAALPAETKFAIIGAGFAGLGAAIKLLQAGHRDLVVLERAAEVGGTWRDNTYPGCRCDVQSNLYSFSFAPNPNWSNTYPSQPELRAYLGQVAARFGVLPHVRFGQQVAGLRWDSGRRRWLISTQDGVLAARYVISGVGSLVEPSLPDIPGVTSFEGAIMHSARWDAGWSAAGRRVAVIGTGASAIQIVPAIRPQVERLTIFQRTAPFVVPHNARPVPRWRRAVYRHVPGVQRLSRAFTYWTREILAIGFIKKPEILKKAETVWRRHMERAVRDPVKREQLTPHYHLGCKRVLPSNDFYPAIAASNVDLVTEKIIEIRPDAIVTADGQRYPVDTIILATGFHVTDNPMFDKVTGRGGRTLADAFDQTYLGTVVPGFPNYFHLTGANTGLGHSSMVFMIESQLRYVAGAIEATEAAGGGPAEVRAEVSARYNAELQRKLPGTVWASGCASWYLDRDGRNLTLWPGFTFDFWRRTRHFRRSDFTLSRARH